MTEAVVTQGDRELVSVSVGGRLFALDIMSVREIRGWTGSTPLPHAPSYVLGLLNLRGSIVPIVDLGARLGGAATTVTQTSVVVVVEIGERLVGLLVDAVCDIVPVAQGAIQPAPDVGDSAVADFVRGVLSAGEGLMSLLTLENVLPAEPKMAA